MDLPYDAACMYLHPSISFLFLFPCLYSEPQYIFPFTSRVTLLEINGHTVHCVPIKFWLFLSIVRCDNYALLILSIHVSPSFCPFLLRYPFECNDFIQFRLDLSLRLPLMVWLCTMAVSDDSIWSRVQDRYWSNVGNVLIVCCFAYLHISSLFLFDVQPCIYTWKQN